VAVTTETLVRYLASQCGNCCGRSDTEIDFIRAFHFSPVNFIPPLLHIHSFIYHPRCIMFFSQYFSFPLSVSFHHCSIFIHLPPTLYNVFLPALQFSPVSIIPPLLHTHSFIYHPRCIMFSHSTSVFPRQYHSTIAPYSFIHLPPTLYNVFLPVLQFSPISIIPPLLHIHSSTTHTV